MKAFSFSILLLVFLVVGCAHSPDLSAPSALPVEPPQVRQEMEGTHSVPTPPPSPKTPVKSETGNVDEYGDIQVSAESVSEEAKVEIADPLEPFNRAMYHFNDKLYFWVLKPVAQGYGTVVPEMARIGVSNFFTNLTFPIRFVNCLLQANLGGAAVEVGRFTINTIWGIGGLLDIASRKDVDLVKQDEDLGQTLGVYGLGQGFYINWPFFGPSSPRDTVGLVGMHS